MAVICGVTWSKKMDEKKWFLSKTIWASLAIVLAALGNQFGIPLVATELTDTMFNAVVGISGLVALFGRFTAKTTVAPTLT